MDQLLNLNSKHNLIKECEVKANMNSIVFKLFKLDPKLSDLTMNRLKIM